jgi:hypothetical protein
LEQRANGEAIAGERSNGKLGAVGFCFGGYIVNMLAAVIPGTLDAGVPFYGTPAARELRKNITAPLLIHLGGLDERVNASWPEYEEDLKAIEADYTRMRITASTMIPRAATTKSKLTSLGAAPSPFSKSIFIEREVLNGGDLGVLCWEPHGARSWSGYPLRAWREDGTPNRAMDAFLEESRKK